MQRFQGLPLIYLKERADFVDRLLFRRIYRFDCERSLIARGNLRRTHFGNLHVGSVITGATRNDRVFSRVDEDLKLSTRVATDRA